MYILIYGESRGSDRARMYFGSDPCAARAVCLRRTRQKVAPAFARKVRPGCG